MFTRIGADLAIHLLLTACRVLDALLNNGLRNRTRDGVLHTLNSVLQACNAVQDEWVATKVQAGLGSGSPEDLENWVSIRASAMLRYARGQLRRQEFEFEWTELIPASDAENVASGGASDKKSLKDRIADRKHSSEESLISLE